MRFYGTLCEKSAYFSNNNMRHLFKRAMHYNCISYAVKYIVSPYIIYLK